MSNVIHLSSHVNPYFVLPEPITKRNIQLLNPQLNYIFMGKSGTPSFNPIGSMLGGTSIGTLYEKAHLTAGKVSTLSKWIGKVGDCTERKVALCSQVKGCEARLNTNAIIEKLAYDLYREMGRGYFLCPKTRLSRQPVIDEFTKSHPVAKALAAPLVVGGQGVESSLRIMSRFVEGYRDLHELKCKDGDQTLPIMAYIQKYKAPPVKVIHPSSKYEVELKGLLALAAIARVLGDPDCIGGGGGNVGYRIKDDEHLEVVKIDPGMCFSFFPNTQENRIYRSFHKLDNKHGWKDLKDLQLASGDVETCFKWSELNPSQKEEFLGALFNTTRYLCQDNIIEYLIYRDDRFNLEETVQLPPQEALKRKEGLKDWISVQENAIYAADLQDYLLNHCEILLRTRYIDSLGELPLMATNETYPIRELFVPLTLVQVEETPPVKISRISKDLEPQGSDKKGRDKGAFQKANAISFVQERDSILEAIEHLRREKKSIDLTDLFDPIQLNGNKPIRTVLLEGGAGVGKSTICMKIAHDWASGKLWHEKFNYVFWVPLRKLPALIGAGKPLFNIKESDTFLATTLAVILMENTAFTSFFQNILHSQSDRILLLLDGYDETTEAVRQVIDPLLESKKYPLLLTSRPNATADLYKHMDRYVESSGFSKIHIAQYAAVYFNRKVESKQQIQDFLSAIERDINTKAIAYIPLQLQMLCYLWEKSGSLPTTTTLIYSEMVESVLMWQEKRLSKIEPAKYESIRLCLGGIALQGIQSRELLISQHEILTAISGFNISQKELEETGLLFKSGDRYQFLHLTFQEYLAAYFIFKQPDCDSYILKYRYYSAFQLVIAFVGGLIAKDNGDDVKSMSIKIFIQTLHAQGGDLLGFYQLELTLRCLSECSNPEIEKWVEKQYGVYSLLIKLVEDYVKKSELIWLGDHIFRLFERNKIPKLYVESTFKFLIDHIQEERACLALRSLHRIFLQEEKIETVRKLILRASLYKSSHIVLHLYRNYLPDRWEKTFELFESWSKSPNSHICSFPEDLGEILTENIPDGQWKRLFEVYLNIVKRKDYYSDFNTVINRTFQIVIKETPLAERETTLKTIRDTFRCLSTFSPNLELLAKAMIDLVQKAPLNEQEKAYQILEEDHRNFCPDIRMELVKALRYFKPEEQNTIPGAIFRILYENLNNKKYSFFITAANSLTQLEGVFDANDWKKLFESFEKRLVKEQKYDGFGDAELGLSRLIRNAPLKQVAEAAKGSLRVLKAANYRWFFPQKMLSALFELVEKSYLNTKEELFNLFLEDIINPQPRVSYAAMKGLCKLVLKMSSEDWGLYFKILQKKSTDLNMNAIARICMSLIVYAQSKKYSDTVKSLDSLIELQEIKQDLLLKAEVLKDLASMSDHILPENWIVFRSHIQNLLNHSHDSSFKAGLSIVDHLKESTLTENGLDIYEICAEALEKREKKTYDDEAVRDFLQIVKKIIQNNPQIGADILIRLINLECTKFHHILECIEWFIMKHPLEGVVFVLKYYKPYYKFIRVISNLKLILLNPSDEQFLTIVTAISKSAISIDPEDKKILYQLLSHNPLTDYVSRYNKNIASNSSCVIC